MSKTLRQREHDHIFGQDRKRPGEIRTIVVIIITAAMMIVEIAAGVVFGSMALFADGLHMASHAAALGINAFAYIYARRHAHDPSYSFGTGKMNALGGFTGAILLAVFALMMAVESVVRIIHPINIAFNQAILVAVLGLIVNGVSMVILGHGGHHHDHDDHHHEEHSHDHSNGHHDHNLRAGYFHVLADALTSVLAIVALLVAKYVGLIWMDPLMGIVGALLVSRWSLGLLRTTGAVLLDRQGPEQLRQKIQRNVEASDARVVDLHLWSIGPGIYSLTLAIVAENPRPPEHYKELLPPHSGLVHATVEVHPTEDGFQATL